MLTYYRSLKATRSLNLPATLTTITFVGGRILATRRGSTIDAYRPLASPIPESKLNLRPSSRIDALHDPATFTAVKSALEGSPSSSAPSWPKQGRRNGLHSAVYSDLCDQECQMTREEALRSFQLRPKRTACIWAGWKALDAR